MEHLRWKLHSHEQATRLHLVAEKDSRIVAARLFLASDIKVRERLLLCYQAVDVCVHPDFREAGLIATMQTHDYDHYERAFDFKLIGQGRHPAMKKLRRRLGSEPFGNAIEVLAYPLPPRSASSRRAGPQDQSWTIVEPAMFDDRINEFWEEASRPFDFIIRRTDEFLNWRYSDRRSGRFTVKMAEQAGRILGYGVLCMSKGRGQIADLLVLPARDDILRALVREAITHFREERATAIRCWLPSHHPYRDILQRLGFVGARRRKLPLGYRPLRTSAAEMEFLHSRNAAIHLTIGDTDFV
jgi:hypothetical protein